MKMCKYANRQMKWYSSFKLRNWFCSQHSRYYHLRLCHSLQHSVILVFKKFHAETQKGRHRSVARWERCEKYDDDFKWTL